MPAFSGPSLPRACPHGPRSSGRTSRTASPEARAAAASSSRCGGAPACPSGRVARPPHHPPPATRAQHAESAALRGPGGVTRGRAGAAGVWGGSRLGPGHTRDCRSDRGHVAGDWVTWRGRASTLRPRGFFGGDVPPGDTRRPGPVAPPRGCRACLVRAGPQNRRSQERPRAVPRACGRACALAPPCVLARGAAAMPHRGRAFRGGGGVEQQSDDVPVAGLGRQCNSRGSVLRGGAGHGAGREAGRGGRRGGVGVRRR